MGLDTKVKKIAPKYKEYILSVVEPIKNELNIAFRDIKTGEQTAYSLKDWLHPFVVWPKIKQNADLYFDKAKIKEESMKILDQLQEKINSELPHIRVERFERAFPVLHAYLSLKAKPLIEKLVRELNLSKEQQNIFDLPIKIPTFYQNIIRNTFAEPGDIVKIDQGYFDILKQKKELEQEFDALTKEIFQKFKDRTKAYTTRHINVLHDIFVEYDGTNFFNIKEKLSEDNYTKKLGDFWEKRKELADAVFDLDKKIEEVHDSNSAIFHNRNQDIIGSKSKDYSLETIINDPKLIKDRRKMSGQELREQLWVSIDVEKPLYKYEDEAEVSWITLVYHRDGKMIKKETHTLRNPGLKKRDGREIFSYKNYDNMLKGVNASINKKNPDVCSSDNAIYDFKQTRDGSNEDFAIGAEGEEPKVRVSTKFFEKIGLRGKIIFDQLRWAQMFFPHLPNKKLNLISKVVLGQDAFDKKINYDQNEILERIAIDYRYYYENKDSIGEDITSLLVKEAKVNSMSEIKPKKLSMYAARVSEDYVGSDTEILPKILYSDIGKLTLDILCEFCQKFDISIQELVTFNNISKKHKWLFYEKTGIPFDFMFPKNNDYFQKLETNALNRLKTLKNKSIKSSNKPGLHKNVYHVYVPFSNAFLDMFEFRENTKELAQQFPKEYNSLIEKYFYSNMIEAFMRVATVDYMEILKEDSKLRKDPITNVIISPGFKKTYDKVLKKIEDGRKKHIPVDKKFGISKKRINSYDKDDLESLKKGSVRTDILNAYAYYESKSSSEEKQIDTDIHRFLDKNNISLDDFVNAVRLTAKNQSPKSLIKYNKSVKRFFGKLLKDPYDFEVLFDENYEKINSFLNPEKNLKNFSETIDTFLKKNGYEVIYKNGNYLYLVGENEEALADLDSPLVFIDKIDSVYIDAEAESKQKIYYNLFNYWHGIKIKDHPDNNVSFYEMDLFGGFLSSMFELDNKFSEFDQQKEPVISEFKTKVDRLFDGELTNEEMCTYIKSKEVYVAKVVGKKGKQEFSSLEELNKAEIDRCDYRARVLDHARNLLIPIINSPEKISKMLRLDCRKIYALHKKTHKAMDKNNKPDSQSNLF